MVCLTRTHLPMDCLMVTSKATSAAVPKAKHCERLLHSVFARILTRHRARFSYHKTFAEALCLFNRVPPSATGSSVRKAAPGYRPPIASNSLRSA